MELIFVTTPRSGDEVTGCGRFLPDILRCPLLNFDTFKTVFILLLDTSTVHVWSLDPLVPGPSALAASCSLRVVVSVSSGQVSGVGGSGWSSSGVVWVSSSVRGAGVGLLALFWVGLACRGLVLCSCSWFAASGCGVARLGP